MTLSNEISKFMEEYGVLADEVWAVRPGIYAVKHKALERIAIEKGIEQKDFKVLALDQEKKCAAVEVCAAMNGRAVRTTGEASPANCKNAYPLAMAEKRAWDRAYLKLLAAHGDIYSESEADEFVDPGQGERGRLLPSSQYARNECDKLMRSMRNCNSMDMLDAWAAAHKEEIRAQPEKFASAIRELFAEMRDELRTKETA